MSQEVLLDQQEFRQLRARLLEKPRQFYERLARELALAAHGDLHAAPLLADGHLKLGTILYDLGRFSDAQSQFQAGTDLFLELARERPDEPAHRISLAGGYSKLGLVLEHLGSRKEAASAMENAIATLEPLVATNQLLPRSLHNLAQNQNNLGSLHARAGDGKTGRKYLESDNRGRDEARRRISRRPAVLDFACQGLYRSEHALGRTETSATRQASSRRQWRSKRNWWRGIRTWPSIRICWAIARSIWERAPTFRVRAGGS